MVPRTDTKSLRSRVIKINRFNDEKMRTYSIFCFIIELLIHSRNARSSARFRKTKELGMITRDCLRVTYEYIFLIGFSYHFFIATIIAVS